MTHATVAALARLAVTGDELTYEILPNQLATVTVGRLVVVTLRGRPIPGVVTALRRHRPRGVDRLASIVATTPIRLPPELIELARSVRRWYWQPLGLILAAMLPPPLGRWSVIPDQARTGEPRITLVAGRTIAVVGPPTSRYAQYRRLIDRATAAGRSVVLVFGHHVDLDRFVQAAARPVTRWEIAQGRTARWQQWQAIATAAHPLVVAGVRSAAFAPVPNLGLIIVDAPAARGHKDDQAPYYQTARVAHLRSKLTGAHVVLGDDLPPLTPSPSRLAFLQPATTPIELLASDPADPQLLQAPTESWLEALPPADRCFILLNRLGAGSLRCRDCRSPVRCPRCDAVPVVSGANLGCGQCGWRQATPAACLRCGSPVLVLRGSGTEAIAERIRRLLNEPVSVLDHLHPPSRDRQRVTVGTEFALPYLAGAPPEHALFLGLDLLRQRASYDATERTLRLIQQLRGLSRQLAIETAQPGDPWLAAVRAGSLRSLANHERADRVRYGFPPLATLVRLTSTEEERLRAIRTALEQQSALRYPVFGPTPTRERRRVQLIARFPASIPPERFLAPLDQAGLLRRVTIDVDPTVESLG